MRILVLLSLVIVVGCERAPVEESGDSADVGAVEDASGSSVENSTDLKWPADFSVWRDRRIEGGKTLPQCRGDWSIVPIDDEFTLYKCDRFRPLSLTKEGVLSVHAREGAVFMVTETSTFDDDEVFAETRAKVQRINATREVEVPSSLDGSVDRVWSIDDYLAVMSIGSGGLSLLYVNDLDELRLVMDRVDARSKPAKTGGRYRLGELDYTVEEVRKEPFVGRGPQRWDSRKDSDFVVIDYKVRNRSRTVFQNDPATMVLLAGERRYETDERAERAFMSSDRTGRYRQPLDRMKERLRARVFEVESDVIRGSMLLVIHADGDRMVLDLKLGEP